jgi:hypothetical protein
VNFYAHFPFFVIDLKLNTGYFHIISIRNFDFCENLYGGINYLLKGVNEFILSTCIVRCGWNSVLYIFTWCYWALTGFMEMGAGKVVLVLWALLKMHWRVYPKTWHFECKERLGELCVLCRGLYHCVISKEWIWSQNIFDNIWNILQPDFSGPEPHAAA